jgi:hypothetical protein
MARVRIECNLDKRARPVTHREIAIMTVKNEGDFRLGFWFALLLARTLDFDKDLDIIYDQLRSIARGELTLIASPEEARAKMINEINRLETTLGRPPNEHERSLLEQAMNAAAVTNRKEQDARNRELATLTLRLMGQRPA